MKYFWINFLAIFFLTSLSLMADEPSDKTQVIDPYALGQKAMAEKDYAKASSHFSQAIQEDPKFMDAYQNYARSLVMEGKRKEGLAVLDKAIRQASKESEKKELREQKIQLADIFYTNEAFQTYQNALNNLRSKKMRAAIQLFEKSLAMEPHNLAILLAYGKSLQEVDEWESSIKILEQAFALHKDNFELRYYLGKALLNKDSERTQQLIKPLIEKDNAEEKDVLLFAKALYRTGKIKDAQSILEGAIAKNPTMLEAHYWLGSFYATSPVDQWTARKYLLLFIRRATGKEEFDDLVKQAARLLQQINKDLGVEHIDRKKS